MTTLEAHRELEECEMIPLTDGFMSTKSLSRDNLGGFFVKPLDTEPKTD